MKRESKASADAKLLDGAEAMKIKYVRILEDALKTSVRQTRARSWHEENRAALESYTAYVERYGAFSDGLRSF